MDVKKKSVREGYFKDLPADIQGKVLEVHKLMVDRMDEMMHAEENKDIVRCPYTMSKLRDFSQPIDQEGDVGYVTVGEVACGKDKKEYEIMLQLTPHIRTPMIDERDKYLMDFLKKLFKVIKADIKQKYGLRLESEGEDGDGYEGFDLYFIGDEAQAVWEAFEDHGTRTYREFTDVTPGIFEFYTTRFSYGFDNFMEAFDPEKPKKFPKHKFFVTHSDDEPIMEAAVGVDKNITAAKREMAAISQQIIDARARGKGINRANLIRYATIINDNLLHAWAPSYQSFKIELGSKRRGKMVEFKTPPITADFIGRFIEGREQLSGFLHRNPTITMKIAPEVFDSMKNANDAFDFFKAAISYYDSKVDQYGVSLMVEVKKLGHEMHHLIATTKLRAIVSCPLTMLFVFEDVDMSKKDNFSIGQDDIDTVNEFVRNIAKHHSNPKRDIKDIVDGMYRTVETLQEYVSEEKYSDFIFLPEAVQEWLNGKYTTESQKAEDAFIHELTDWHWSRFQKDDKLRYLQEKFGVKKLKKIPRDIVAYITIEGEAIKDANDKMMIVSYCLGKLEIVEWYIELIDSNSKKYMVPHDKPYLVSLRTQLLACYKKIMDTPIPKNRPIISIDYPQGYEG